MVNSISHNNYGDSFPKDTRKGSHTEIAMTVGRNVGSKLEKCFDRQSLQSRAEHFSGETGGAGKEGMRDGDMFSVENAKPGFGKRSQWT